jgi:hypothetical protein
MHEQILSGPAQQDRAVIATLLRGSLVRPTVSDEDGTENDQ